MKKTFLMILMLVAAFSAFSQNDSVAIVTDSIDSVVVDAIPIDTMARQTEFDMPITHHTIKIIPYAIFHPTVFYEFGFGKKHALELSVGGCPRTEGHRDYNYPNTLFSGLDYRYYDFIDNYSRIVLRAGIHLVSAWGDFQLFDYSDGWDIHTRTYHYSEHLLVPSVGFGLQFGKWESISAEFICNASLLIIKAIYDDRVKCSKMLRETSDAFIFLNMLNFRLGYTF